MDAKLLRAVRIRCRTIRRSSKPILVCRWKPERRLPVLKVENLSVSYGCINALHDVSLAVPDGSIVTLIGANGAGKTTTLRAISGLIKSSGSVRYAGEEM